MSRLIKNYKIQESYREETPRKVDREAGIIRDVKVLGKVSRNGREYTQEAIEKAAHLYEGAKVYINHRDPKSRSSRDYNDGIGELRSVVVSEDGLRADLHYNRKHPAAERLAEDAERFPGSFGMSHDADGQARKTGKKTIVESIDTVNSVDVVGSPATNKGLFEADEPQEIRMVKTTIRSLVESITGATVKAKLVKHLKEMDGTPDAAAMDSPVDVPDAADTESGGSEDQIDAAFKAMVNGVLDDDSLDVSGKLAKIKLILTSQDKLLNGGESKAPPTTDGGGDAEKKPATEGSDSEVGKLLEELKAERLDMKSERLLESAGIAVTEAKLKILRTADEATRNELIEGWKPRTAPVKGNRPAFPGRKEPIQEGAATDSDAGLADARRAFGLKSKV